VLLCSARARGLLCAASTTVLIALLALVPVLQVVVVVVVVVVGVVFALFVVCTTAVTASFWFARVLMSHHSLVGFVVVPANLDRQALRKEGRQVLPRPQGFAQLLDRLR
jgi:hypothetical protein